MADDLRIPEGLIGQHVLVLPAAALVHAAEQIGQLGSVALSSLKVRSGEHLAAIWTTAVLGSPPTRFDSGDGTPDLVFHSPIQAFDGRHPPATMDFQVKSLRGGYRRFEAVIDADLTADRLPREDTYSVVFESIDGVLPDCGEMARVASLQFPSKEPADGSHQVFIVVHPLDRATVEAWSEHPVLAEPMPSFDCPANVSGVWILWWPGLVTVWSSHTREWTRVFLAGSENGEDLDVDPLEPIERAELHLLACIDRPTASPYQFGLTQPGGSADQGGRAD